MSACPAFESVTISLLLLSSTLSLKHTKVYVLGLNTSCFGVPASGVKAFVAPTPATVPLSVPTKLPELS